MSTRQLEALFRPRSIVVIGASEHDKSLGGTVLKNLINGGFEGQVCALNRKDYSSVHSVPCYTRVRQLPADIDLAIICTPAATVPRLVRSLGKQGVRSALVVMGGLASIQSRSGRTLTEATLAAARSSGIRIMGPNSLGVIVPRLQLNASYAHLIPNDGEVAYVGESAMLGSAMLDWAVDRDIGFSHFVTLGDSADVDIDDVVDYLASDWRTRAILLHVERVKNPRAFVSAVSAAARGKLILVLKTSQILPDQVYTHPPPAGLSNGDNVYDAVLHRTGALRVHASNELFDALRTLTVAGNIKPGALGIISNGGGPAALAVDALQRSGGQLAELTEESKTELKALLPVWARADNPVDLSLIATPELYAKALDILRRDPEVASILVLHAPNRRHPPADIAAAVIEHTRNHDTPIMTSWIGGSTVGEARQLFDEAEIPTYPTPDRAISALAQMQRWQNDQGFLRQTPSEPPKQDGEARQAADDIIKKVRKAKRKRLSATEGFELITSYGIPVAEYCITDDLDEALAWHKAQDKAIAVKIRNDELDRPFRPTTGPTSRWRGVVPDIENAAGVKQSMTALSAWSKHYFPDAPPSGFMLQEMRRGLNSLQLMLGITRDSTFGPVLLIGAGGATVTSEGWRRIGIPPLNMSLARDLLRESEIGKKLKEASRDPEARLDSLAEMLVRLSQLAIDQPHIQSLEINPILLNSSGLLALDATVELGEPAELAISPYPYHLVQSLTLKSGNEVVLRPIRAEDEPAHQIFHDSLSPEALRYRYFHSRKKFNHRELAQMTQIDYDREMVFIAMQSSSNDNSADRTLGEVRAWIDPDNVRAEFSVIVLDELRGEGLGRALMQSMMDYCKSRTTLQVVGTVLPDNQPMLKLAEQLGFEQNLNQEHDVAEIRLQLNKPKAEWQRQRLLLPVS